jgi:hypothetical protein
VQASRGGDMGGVLYVTFDGNHQACYVWWNGSDRKANLNWVSNFDNSNDWFLFRYSLHFSPDYLSGEFCFKSWLFQPPSILPISSNRIRKLNFNFEEFFSRKT